MTSYADANVSNVVSTTSEFVLTHTFSAQESTMVRSNGLFLRLYVLGDVPLALYIDRIDWSS